MTERPGTGRPTGEPQPAAAPSDGAFGRGEPPSDQAPPPSEETTTTPGGEPEDHAPAHEGTAVDEQDPAPARAPSDQARPPSDDARPPSDQPSAPSDQTPPQADALGDELSLARQALTELTTDLQRLQAEYVNYKRRVDRDRELVRQNATFAVLRELLPVMDSIDRAREHGDLEPGFKAVADALETAVTKLGLTKFGEPGEEFDPNQHEALMHGHSPEVTTTTVDVVAQAGYRIGERVVRPARVTVLDPG